MNSATRSVIAFVSTLAIGTACTLVSPEQTQSAETAVPASPSTVPLPTRSAPTTEAPQPSPTRAVPGATPTFTLAGFPEDQLHTVKNDAGSIAAIIPTVWSDVRSSEWKDGREVVIGHVLTAATDLEAFLRWEVEGVSISVSRNPGIGYVQLLDADYLKYGEICDDPFKTYWEWTSQNHRGKYFVLDDCAGVRDGWLSVMSVVPSGDTGAYVAEVLAYDMIPIFGETFRDILMGFEVFPEKLP